MGPGGLMVVLSSTRAWVRGFVVSGSAGRRRFVAAAQEDRVAQAVVELRMGGSKELWRRSLLIEFGGLAGVAIGNGGRPWTSREAWGELLSTGEGYGQRRALEALESGCRRAEDLVEMSRLAGRARWIEGIDVSHTRGEWTTFACARVIDGAVDEEAGRVWRVPGGAPGDDCSALAYGIEQRLREGGPRADLLVVDGGKAQVAAVSAAIERAFGGGRAPRRVVGLAKGDRNEGVVAMREGETLYDETKQVIARGDAVPRLVRLARDAAHSRALRGHRELRDAAFLEEEEKPPPPLLRRGRKVKNKKTEALDILERERLRRSLLRGLGETDPLVAVTTKSRPSCLSPLDHDDETARDAQRRRRDEFVERDDARLKNKNEFVLTAPYEATEPQKRAVDDVLSRLDCDESGGLALLKGATGTGKTYAIARIIAKRGLPALVLAPNKLLAAQLYGEIKDLLRHNAVEYFVSYYDYYRPESFSATLDVYSSKRSAINDRLDELRHRATKSLTSRRDVVVVASVSCVYGLGVPSAYEPTAFRRGDDLVAVADTLRVLGYTSDDDNDDAASRGSVRVSAAGASTVLTIAQPADARATVVLEFDDRDRLQSAIEAGTPVDEVQLLPASHYAAAARDLERASRDITRELDERLVELRSLGKSAAADRLESRTLSDLELLRDTGTCPGVENYSRHLNGAAPGDPPVTLLDYFPPGDPRFLLIVDESHITVGQLGAAFEADRARKRNLVDHGFRLPSALDNRPLSAREFWETKVDRAVFVSATPGKHERALLKSRAPETALDAHLPAAELVIRPTLILDPVVLVKPASDQVDRALDECVTRASRHERSILVASTRAAAKNIAKRVAERGLPLRVEALTGDLKPQKRLDILARLRARHLDAIVGVNLLREGIDLDVSLVCVLDADKEGFLRSDTALIQIIGRAARHVRGTALLYADDVTPSMRRAIDETDARRAVQQAYNDRRQLQATPLRWSKSYAAATALGGLAQH
ncbi:hypothetical protein CTAYLR_001899 [Chrysophaeum taylorii]|uniref:Excinuclease ABC subunit B n=1 Tax=Chrysophaeum taylorii TaxID=2483200 RepID=A0AAD7U8C5_9STRA|nr:hypothetical protein CTAYLR_001899 [Chrysophaeum taylorii]